MRSRVLLVLGLVATLLASGCGESDPPAPVDASVGVDAEPRLAAEVILINYLGVKYVGDGTPTGRDKAAALALADQLMAELREHPERWDALVQEHSEWPVAATGGRVDSWPRSQTASDFAIVPDLAIGEIGGPVDATFGILILKRVEPIGPSLLSARRLLVAWEGGARTPAGVTRTKAEAKARAQELHERAAADPGGFEALVRAESDGWDVERGGFLGTWPVETNRYPLIYDAAVGSVPVGGISKPVPTEFGYEVFQRLEPDPGTVQLAGSHLLVSHKDAKSPRSERTRDEALALAQKLAAELAADPVQFGVVARTWSDDGSKERGGDLGAWRVGKKLPAQLDSAFLALRYGEVGGPVETEFGFHLLHRRKSPEDFALDYRAPKGDPALDEEVPENAEYGVVDEDAPAELRVGGQGDAPEGHGGHGGHDEHDGHGH